RDLYGRYFACFQCGHYLSKAEEAALRYSSSLGMIEGASRKEPGCSSSENSDEYLADADEQLV
ncbi:MAG TPA: hypothetical protein VFA32_21295, partial [Dehalococcoidia bacterium]|nr:hypothetical protein [Dehalococcoidia bacterium]